MCLGWSQGVWILFVAPSVFRSLIHKHERTHCTHHQINFSLIYVRTLLGSRGVARASRFPWAAPQYVGNQGNESVDMWARGTGSRPTWSRQQRHPIPPITTNPKTYLFLLVSHFSYSWGAPEGQTPLFHTVGSFFWHRKSKTTQKKNNFCLLSWSDCAKLLTVVQMWPPQAVEQPPATAECSF